MNYPITVTILGKEYQVACPENEKEALIASASMLHDNMEKIHATGKIVGLERIAVIAALNLAHELISLQQGDQVQKEFNNSILQMKDKVTLFLEEVNQSK